jgi:arylsulfatase A-like enzyme
MKIITGAFMALLMSVGLFAQKDVVGSRPNIVLIVSDDTGWGDFGPYGGGENLGITAPSID